MYRYAERAPEKSKHITSSRPVPDGEPCGDNKHHFHGVTFSRWLLWQIVMTTVTLLARLSEYGLDSGANKRKGGRGSEHLWGLFRRSVEKREEAAVRWRIKKFSGTSCICYIHLMHLLCAACTALCCNFFLKPSPTQTHALPLCMCRVPSWSEMDLFFFFSQYIMTPDTHPGQGVWFLFSC